MVEERERPMVMGHTMHTIRLKRCKSDDPKFRWYREDGRPVSPIFTSFAQAVNFPERNPFLTDQEWSEFYPPEGKSPDELEHY